jgi:AcrR family transcriptional regulator
LSDRGRPRSFDRAVALRRAMEVFWANGYDAASLSSLTKAMGINSPSLYAAFGSKEALFREAVDLYLATDGSSVWENIEDAPTVRDSLRHFLRASAEGFTRNGRLRGCLAILGVLHANDANSEPHRDLRRRRKQKVQLLCDRIGRAVREGELPARSDCQTIATFFAAVQQGMAIQARDGVSRDTLLAVAEAAMSGWDGVISGNQKPERLMRSRRLKRQ